MSWNGLMCCDPSSREIPARRAGVLRTALVASAALVTAALAAGCATDAGQGGAETGTVVLPLTQAGPRGEIYRLSNAVLDLTSSATRQTQTVSASPADPTLTVPLAPGLVTVFLRDGWQLEKSTDGGSIFQPVSALLGSLNPSGVRVLAAQPAFLRFDFLVRDSNGTLNISLGVIPKPRELAGGYIIQTATGEFADYAIGRNGRLDFAVFFQLTTLVSQTLPDGTKQHVYTAFSAGGSLGPNPQDAGAVAAEFYNDPIGTMAGPVAQDMTGGSLTYTVAAKPDGKIEMTGQLAGGATIIDFGPSVIEVPPGLDADGFPRDEFFYDSETPFTQSSDQGQLTGIMRVRHLLPTP